MGSLHGVRAPCKAGVVGTARRRRLTGATAITVPCRPTGRSSAKSL